MFNPCTDGKCTGKDRTGWGFDECRNCRLRQLEDEVDSLKYKIRTELEPRIKAEKRAYDIYISTPKEGE